MRKNIATTLFSMLLMMSCNTVSAATVICSDAGSGLFDNESDLNSIVTTCRDTNLNISSQVAISAEVLFGKSTMQSAELAVTAGSAVTNSVKLFAFNFAKDFYEGFSIYSQSSVGPFKDLDLPQLKVDDPGRARVPVPSAVWLFVSGLLALVTVSRRKY
jgi:hypothetical protein